LTKVSARFYRPELDVLRFLAFLLVFFHHGLETTSGILSSIRISGAFGVCLFFLLSSYLITELLEREEAQSGAIHLPAFYVRRILRIWPLYFGALLFDFFLQHHVAPGVFTTPRLLAFLLLAGNWYVAHHGFTWTFSTPLWSISVEEQFYLLWPSMRKYFRRTASIIFSVAMFVLAYVALAIYCHLGEGQASPLWVNSLVQFQFFSSGALLALYLRGKTPDLKPIFRAVIFAAGLMSLFLAQYVFHVKESDVPLTFTALSAGYLLVNLGCVLLFLSFLGEVRLGASKLLVYLGRISFGLYVFHWMMLRIAIRLVQKISRQHHIPGAVHGALILALAFVLTVMLAALSYRFFESPILRFKKRFEFVRTRTV
jgi:peptidoglycan/LPS O-acetylase OafA/YrhL